MKPVDVRWKTYSSEGERVGVSYQPPPDTHSQTVTVVVDDRHLQRRTTTIGGRHE
jgi:hypothetical protein